MRHPSTRLAIACLVGALSLVWACDPGILYSEFSAGSGDGAGPADANVRRSDGGAPVDGSTTPPPIYWDAGSGGSRDTIPPPRDAGSGWRGFFPTSAIWYRDHSGARLHSSSAAVISSLASSGGWGQSNSMWIDFSLDVNHVNTSAPFRSFTRTSDHFLPDCDTSQVPIPLGGAIEGHSGYDCKDGGDCHLIVAHWPTRKLYEMWRADIEGSSFRGGCLVVWDMSRNYGMKGRGENCTSADAAGLPIAPLLFTADEVAAGKIEHAIRFILPNKRIRKNAYMNPGTHATSVASGGTNAPPYGVHLRMKASTNISGLSRGAQVVARAMKKYGMFLADGGNITLTAMTDRSTTAKWSGLLGPRDLTSVKVTDFEVIDHGAVIPYTRTCRRLP